MIGIIVATHGKMSKGMEETMKLIMSEQKRFTTMSLTFDDSVDEFGEELKKNISELDDGDGVLVLVDILGGSPCNQASKYIGTLNIKLLTGVNLPMIFGALEARMQGMTLQDAAVHCVKQAKESIWDIEEFVKSID